MPGRSFLGQWYFVRPLFSFWHTQQWRSVLEMVVTFRQGHRVGAIFSRIDYFSLSARFSSYHKVFVFTGCFTCPLSVTILLQITNTSKSKALSDHFDGIQRLCYYRGTRLGFVLPFFQSKRRPGATLVCRLYCRKSTTLLLSST